MLFETMADQLLPNFRNSNVILMSNASFDEEKIQRKIESTGESEKFFACALQLALTGWGGQNYGKATLGDDTFDIAEFIEGYGGYTENDVNTNLDDDDLTPKRIIRVFRWQISDWIKTKNTESFLMRKYGSRSSRRYKHLIFPTGEHLVETEEEANALKEVYTKLDSTRGTDFVKRLDRVFQARNIFE